MSITRKSKCQLRKRLQNYIINLPGYEKSQIRYCGYRNDSFFTANEKIYESDEKIHYGFYFNGYQTCGSIFCPVCSGLIKTYRANELNTLCNLWQGHIYMLTFTVSHCRSDRLVDTFSLLKDAYYNFFKNDATKRIFGAVGGTVRSLEVTRKNNGWHPHFHTLLFSSESSVFSEDSVLKLKHIWHRTVKRAGGEADPDKGLFVKPGDAAASYVCKLGSELQGQECKDSCDFLQLLVDRKKILVQEYLVALKGVKWLKWSKGLRDRVRISYLDDSQIVQQGLFVQKRQLKLSQLTLNFLEDTFFKQDHDGKLRDYLTELLNMQHSLKRWSDQPKIQELFDAYCDLQLSKNRRFTPDLDQFHRDMAKLGFEFDFCGIAPNKGG